MNSKHICKDGTPMDIFLKAWVAENDAYPFDHREHVSVLCSMVAEYRAEVQRLHNKLNADSQNFEIACLKEHNLILQQRIEKTAEVLVAVLEFPNCGYSSALCRDLLGELTRSIPTK